MAGWKICIDTNNNGDCEENSEPFITTNNDGYYEFNGLATGVYTIIKIEKPNWQTTEPGTNSYTINLANGEQSSYNNFWNKKLQWGKK